jgi:hypothetical protein
MVPNQGLLHQCAAESTISGMRFERASLGVNPLDESEYAPHKPCRFAAWSDRAGGREWPVHVRLRAFDSGWSAPAARSRWPLEAWVNMAEIGCKDERFCWSNRVPHLAAVCPSRLKELLLANRGPAAPSPFAVELVTILMLFSSGGRARWTPIEPRCAVFPTLR